MLFPPGALLPGCLNPQWQLKIEIILIKTGEYNTVYAFPQQPQVYTVQGEPTLVVATGDAATMYAIAAQRRRRIAFGVVSFCVFMIILGIIIRFAILASY